MDGYSLDIAPLSFGSHGEDNHGDNVMVQPKRSGPFSSLAAKN